MNSLNYLKILTLSAAVLSLTTACSNAGANVLNTAQSVQATEGAKRASQALFKVEGMTCSSCNITVKIAAEKVEGVIKAGASHAKQSAWAHYDPSKTNPQAIAEAITKAGYKATVVQ